MNLVILNGRLTKEPSLKYLESGKAVCKFDIAVDKKYKSNKEDKADFFSIECWGKLAEITSSNLGKGRLVILDGYMKNNNWKDENDKLHKDVVIVANKIQYLDYPKKSDIG